MAKRGRPPKSSTITTKHYTKKELEEKKKIEKKIKDNTSTFTVKVPSFLNKEEGKIFKKIIKDLLSIGIFNEHNQLLLGYYLRNVRRLEDLNELLDKQGYEIEKMDKNGNMWTEPNPFLKTIDTLEMRVMKQEGVLGISISDRLKYLSMIKEDKEEDKDEFNTPIDEEVIKELKQPIDNSTLIDIKDFLNKVGDIK